MSHVVGTFRFGKAGTPSISDLEVVAGPRPKGPQEIPGCDPEVLRTMRGTTRARVGAGCALTVNDITRLSWAGPRVMGNLRKKVPELFDKAGSLTSQEGLLCLHRDLGAGGTSACADVCAGVAESKEIRLAAMKEAVEVGFYSGDTVGVIQNDLFNTSGEMVTADGIRYDDANPVLHRETCAEWARLLGHPLGTGNVTLLLPSTMQKFIAIDSDFDAHYPITYSTEPQSGSVEVIYHVFVDLPPVSGGWRLRDTEHMEFKGEFIALNRRPVLIVPIEGQAPALLGFGPDGLDPHATIARLDGSNLETMINSKVRAVLRALGWIE